MGQGDALAIASRRGPGLRAGLCLPRILDSPVFNDDIGSAGEPFLVTPKLLQGFSRVMRDATASGIAKRFQ